MEKIKDLNIEREKRLEQRNSFVDFGILLDDVNPDIAQSWIRSKSYGVDPRKTTPPYLSDEQLQQLCQENKELIEIARPLMDKLLSLAYETANVMSLHDRNGYMLDMVSCDSLTRNWKEDEFRLGVRWTEQDVGTNGVGLAMALNKPIQILGAEHFCYLQKDMACAAAPIHDSTGKLVGILNISGPILKYDVHILAMVAYAAYSVESQLSLLRSIQFIDMTMDVISEGLLLFDKQYIVIRCSRYATKLFKVQPTAIIGKRVADILRIPDFEIQMQKGGTWNAHLDHVCYVGEKKLSCSVDISPIISNGELLGGVVLLRTSKALKKMTNIYSGNYARYTFDDIITSDPVVLSIFDRMKQAADTDCGILIEGESGTGKELFAYAIHSYSIRKDEPFIAVNCASLPRSLVESELFGYEKGSFSGALSSGNPGKFELANGGTIFLDEIGELPLEIQSKLLRVLDTHRVIRIGGSEEKELDIRIIAATNRDLMSEVYKRNFRDDLYYRLNIFKFHIPPLRERQNDIELLVNSFVTRQNLKGENPPKTASEELIKYLRQHTWPGNVRELQNIVVRTYYCCPNQIMRIADLGGFTPNVSDVAPTDSQQIAPRRNAATDADVDRERMISLIRQYRGDLVAVAQALEISRATLYRRLSKYGISPKAPR